jgi:membrane protease YdiL (CAAX protease family)
MLTISVDYWAAGLLQDVLRLPMDTPGALAFEKIKSASIAALVVLPLTRLSGESLGSIYVQKGRLLISLIIGFVTFSIAATGAVPMSQLLFSGKTVDLGELVKWLPWVLLFVLCNAFFEELLFRGLFLRKLEPYFGKFVSNGLIVLVFTGLHLGVTYTKDQLLFLALLIPLAFLWGYITQKTESIWGSVLFHAGMDLPIVIALFSNL